ncbi:MAG: hypothetical protein KA371_11605 [Acidobacteria bacterium]|nr:hypothetical protein [Acidobacteriota bacterium]
MLHIVTPLFRYHLLERVYQSIPPHDDIVWHLAKTRHRPPLAYAFIARDSRVRVHEIDCDDTDIVAKRNTVFAAITDGYFYLLDDDTVCVDELYRVYREYRAACFEGMIVGASNLSAARRPSADPLLNRLDTGAVLCFHAVLRHVEWAWSADYARDRLFWSRVFAFYGAERTVVLDRTIAAYNHLGPLVRVRKRVLGCSIAWDIYRPWIARVYLLAADARHHARRWARGR